MQKRAKHINSFFSLLLALIVVLSTSGFKLYTHHCSTSHIQNVSIIIPAEACGHAEQTEQNTSCCIIEEPSKDACCQTSEPLNETDNCCTDNEEFVKLEVQTVLNHTTPVVKENSTDSFIALFVVNTFLSYSSQSNPETNLINTSPPPINVTEYLSRIQVYLI